MRIARTFDAQRRASQLPLRCCESPHRCAYIETPVRLCARGALCRERLNATITLMRETVRRDVETHRRGAPASAHLRVGADAALQAPVDDIEPRPFGVN